MRFTSPSLPTIAHFSCSTCIMICSCSRSSGYYEDVPVTQDEVRKLVLKSMDAEINNGQLMDKMIQTTPDDLFKK